MKFSISLRIVSAPFSYLRLCFIYYPQHLNSCLVQLFTIGLKPQEKEKKAEVILPSATPCFSLQHYTIILS